MNRVWRCYLQILALGIVCDASPIASSAPAVEMPIVQLPTGSYRATYYDRDRDIYTFANIRFANAPVGKLRFSKPQKASPFAGVASNGADIMCKQATPTNGLNFFAGDSFMGRFVVPVVLGLAPYGLGLIATETEDCLFLDVYVPGKVFKSPGQQLRVVNWIYGGGYTTGWKSMLGLYSGVGIIELAKNDLVFVAANYRLGAYGWLAGPTISKNAVANAGLWDQRAVLEWIQDNIKLFGGDKDQVTVWGESAGAGSIFNHLVAFGGKQDPLFKRAAILSPYQPLGDRFTNTKQELTYKRIEQLAGCAGKGFECLQMAPIARIDAANLQFQSTSPAGVFGTGNEVDGQWLQDLPSSALKNRKVAQLESLIVSTTMDEGSLFVDNSIKTDGEFRKWFDDLYGPLAAHPKFKQAILEMYPPVGNGNGRFKTQMDRRTAFYRDAGFSCYARYLNKAYAGRSWSMLYNELGGFHGTDIIAIFSRERLRLLGLPVPLSAGFTATAKTYQSYLVSHALTGDPNTLSLKQPGQGKVVAPFWPKTELQVGQYKENVLIVSNDTFTVGKSDSIAAQNCDRWQNVLMQTTRDVGRNPIATIEAIN